MKEWVINNKTVFKRKEDQLFSSVDGEVIMLNIHNEEYYYLNNIASEIWLLLSEPFMFVSLIERLRKKYNVSEKQCIEDTKGYLTELLTKDLIELSNEED